MPEWLIGATKNYELCCPQKDDPYAFGSLSKAETDALEEAFGDGFGDAVLGSEALPLPKEVKSGLLQHPFFFRNTSEEYDDEPPDVFWGDVETFDEAPAPYERFPLRFIPRRLRIYFQNQLDRFFQRMIGEQPEYASWERWQVEELALDRLYEKPWYEFHAIELFDSIEQLERLGKNPSVLLSSFAGELGRLVEQYYWRFRFEGAAIAGIGARRGASAGGTYKAALHQAEHSAWHKAALTIWERRPGLSKIAVAKIIRKQSGAARTAKHIARYISRPQPEKRTTAS